jgi:hypothetical protein
MGYSGSRKPELPTIHQPAYAGQAVVIPTGVSGYAVSKNIPKKGPLNRRSLGFARDDKGEGVASIRHEMVGE